MSFLCFSICLNFAYTLLLFVKLVTANVVVAQNCLLVADLPLRNHSLTYLLGYIFLSTNTGLPVVLKFLKCHRYPEIVLKSAIFLKFYSFGQNVLIWTLVLAAAFNLNAVYSIFLHLFTSHDYVYVADVECQVMFSLSALVTFLGLQY